MPTETPIRFGIVGCGSIGPTHAGAIRQIPDARLVAVADTVGERAEGVAKKFELSRIYKSDAELIRDPDIDVVSFCTPSGVHAAGAVAALNAGKHVIVEKPMDVTLEACDRLIAAEKKSGKKLTIISQHRFDAAAGLVKDVIDSGRLGKLVLATAEVKWWRTQQYYDSGDWRGTWKFDGGGCLMNQGIHTVDVMQWLVGSVKSINAQIRTSAHERIEVEDVAVAHMEFANGALGSLVASTAAYDGLPARIDIYGTEGSAVIEGDRLKSLVLKTGERYTSQAAASHAISVARGGTNSVKDQAVSRSTVAEEGAVWGDAHRAQIQDFIRAIRNDGKPLIDGTEGRKPVEIILGVYESAKSGKTVRL